MVRIGVIGCGALARAAHIPSLLRMSEVRLTALADPDQQARMAASRLAPGAKTVGSYIELLDFVDAVVIATPPQTHTPAALDALRRGLHVYLEKPMAATLDEARRLADAWRGTGLIGALGFNYRFNPVLTQLRADLAAGRAGKPLAVRSIFSIAAPTIPEWKARRSSGGGVLLDLGSHHIDLVRFLFRGEIAEVSARILSARSEQDCATLDIAMDTGLPVQSLFSLCGVEEDTWEIHATKGKLTLGRYTSAEVECIPPGHLHAQLAHLRYGLRRFLPSRSLWDKLRAPLHEPSFPNSLRAFVEAVREGGIQDERMATFEDGLRVMSVIHAAEDSAARERRTQVCQH